MADHRDGPRLVNTLFPLFQQLPPRQQTILMQTLGLQPLGDTRGFLDQAELEAEVEEARAHFRALVDGDR